MLTPDYLNALPESIVPLWQDVEDFIIRDISRRLKKMGGVTGTAELQRIALNNIGKDLKDIDKEIAKALNFTQEQVTELFNKAMDTATADVEKTAQTAGITIYKSNAQRITQAAAAAANGDIANLTKTMGFLSRGGQFTMWTDAYRRALSLAALQVSSGAVDYNTAIRMTLSQFADHGLVVEYASGVRRSLEAAIRQNVLSGVSMAANEVLADNAKQIGADGWEISAHAACAPDHEPIQGRQYSTEDYEQLNNRLSRPIGTLGCKHIASPIIMGISEPAYSEKELSDMAKRNADGITYEGKHYTEYEATQFQRKLERAVRKTKRELIGAEESGDKDMFTAKSIKLRRLREYYKDFSAKAGLPTQNERAQVAGFGRSSASAATYRAEKYYQYWSKSITYTGLPKNLAGYYDMKYNNPKEYGLLKGYVKAVEKGDISPLVGFDQYKQIAHDADDKLIGITAANGVVINGYVNHFIDRIIGQVSEAHAKMRTGVPIEMIKDALLNPVDIGKPRILEDGDVRQTFVGEQCSVTVSVRHSTFIQTNPRSRRR